MIYTSYDKHVRFNCVYEVSKIYITVQLFIINYFMNPGN